jgi:hypothetical protein
LDSEREQELLTLSHNLFISMMVPLFMINMPTIHISEETRTRILAIGKMGDSYDTVIGEILTFFEEHQEADLSQNHKQSKLVTP